jgi:hypothetical protein
MSNSYLNRREEIETYFDKTAAATWQKLTSDAPVSGIRATVRAGRDRMRSTLLSFLPQDLRGARILDADECGGNVDRDNIGPALCRFDGQCPRPAAGIENACSAEVLRQEGKQR